MRVAVLTTQTPHHAFFVKAIAGQFPAIKVFMETTGITPPFETTHPFEAVRERFENGLWFDGRWAQVSEFAPVVEYENINDPGAAIQLKRLNPDITFVFGTRRLKPPVINAAGPRLINLHGGDPERYRGLDTHLWAIYHGEFAGLVTALHMVNSEIDDGDIIAILPVPLAKKMALHQLRAANASVCISLALSALDELNSTGRIKSRPQRDRGRYYSFMPAVLKDMCLRKFERHTECLQ